VIVDVMSLTISSVAASILSSRDGRNPATKREVILMLVVAGIIVLVGFCRGAVEEWIDYYHGRKWPMVSAVIGVVRVTVVPPKGISSTANHSWPTYLATLTYTYRNPEEHTGAYSRSFVKKEDAEAWANSYKDETVNVHVDPRDSTRSVLLDKDL
jgi:hypothetical protein